MTRDEAFADLKNSLAKETEDIVYRCKDCSKYNLCRYYHRRKETSQICHYFELQGKTGKWIEHCECSICKWYQTNRFGFAEDVDYNYCPNCGAKMEVDEWERKWCTRS